MDTLTHRQHNLTRSRGVSNTFQRPVAARSRITRTIAPHITRHFKTAPQDAGRMRSGSNRHNFDKPRRRLPAQHAIRRPNAVIRCGQNTRLSGASTCGKGSEKKYHFHLVLQVAARLYPSAETWPSGRRRSPAKGVGPEGSRGFESLRLRHHTQVFDLMSKIQSSQQPPWSTVTHAGGSKTNEKKDMDYIIQSRGAGTAYRFKMRTPKSLQGLTDPKTEKPFKNWITRSLGANSHLPTAKKMRDIRLAEIRTMEAQVGAGASLDSRFSLERAEGWAEALRAQNAKGGPDNYEHDVYDLIEDEVSAAPKAQRKAFKKVALSGAISLADAVERYLHDRREGNGSGYASIKDTTKNDLRKALWYLCQFMEETEESLFIDDISVDDVEKFRGDFLPEQKSPRAPNGLSLATIEKLCGLLRNLWVWAIERRHIPEAQNPFVQTKGVRRQKRSKEAKRDMYSAREANAIMAAFPQGHRLGDIFRLTLFSGCRADEIQGLDPPFWAGDGRLQCGCIGDKRLSRFCWALTNPWFSVKVITDEVFTGPDTGALPRGTAICCRHNCGVFLVSYLRKSTA